MSASVREVLLKAAEPWQVVFGHRIAAQANGCIHFIGARLPSGYGKLGYASGNWLAHRLSLALYLNDGSAPPIVRHTCDNPLCINPHHLRASSAAENTADMIAKGRAGWQTKPERFKGGTPPRLCGDDNPRCKYSDGAALAILALRATGASYGEIGSRYGIPKSTVATMCVRRRFAPERTQAEVVQALRAAAGAQP